MTDLLQIGASGVRAYQSALATTSENIANVGNTGYSRRGVTVNEVGRATSIQLGQTTKLSGNGAFVSGITRASDGFRVGEARTSGADLARTETGVVWLDRIESSLTGNQLATRLTAFFNAAKGVAADPAASAPRSVMLENASALAAAFGGTGKALASAAADLEGSGTDAAAKLSDLSQSLVRVNHGLARADEGSTARAQLLDERDQVLEKMSALVDVGVSIDAYGRATVRAGGVAGPVLADGEQAGSVTFVTNDEGATSLAVHRAGTIEAIPAHAGALAGIADGAVRIAAAREQLDTMATSFANAVNTVQAGGQALNGSAGAAMFATGTPPSDLSMVLNDPRGIAAASPGEGTRGNGNLAVLDGIRASGGYENDLDQLVTGNAAALSARRDVAMAQGSIHDAAVAARDSVSGVDLDEEAVDLLRFQQAYQASSRVIQVARETLQSIFDIR